MQSVAWLPYDAASSEPPTGEFTNRWKYGSEAGNNGVTVPSLVIAAGTTTAASTTTTTVTVA